MKRKAKMTTMVAVNAAHGWAVSATRINSKTKEPLNAPIIVQPNTTEHISIWDGVDLLVHEIQPNEAAE
jgi:hypothetical protein